MRRPFVVVCRVYSARPALFGQPGVHFNESEQLNKINLSIPELYPPDLICCGANSFVLAGGGGHDT